MSNPAIVKVMNARMGTILRDLSATLGRTRFAMATFVSAGDSFKVTIATWYGPVRRT
jgi:hypothetical protein